MDDLYTASPTSNSKRSSSNNDEKIQGSLNDSWEIPVFLRIPGGFEKPPSNSDWTKLLFLLKEKNVEPSLSNVISMLKTNGSDETVLRKKYDKCKRDWHKKDAELKTQKDKCTELEKKNTVFSG